MKALFGILLAILMLVVTLGTLAGIYYLSENTEFVRAGSSSPTGHVAPTPPPAPVPTPVPAPAPATVPAVPAPTPAPQAP